MWSPRFLIGRRRLRMWSRRFPIWSAPVSDVIALIQDMLTPVAGAVVPLTQLQSLIQDMLTPVAGAVVPLTQLQRVGSGHAHLGVPVRSSRSRNCSPTFTPSCWASPGCSR